VVIIFFFIRQLFSPKTLLWKNNIFEGIIFFFQNSFQKVVNSVKFCHPTKFSDLFSLKNIIPTHSRIFVEKKGPNSPD
jgi:hypothetical protein